MKNQWLAVSGLILSMIASSVHAQKAPCREKLIKLCDVKDQNGNPICEILKQDAVEDPESIAQFLGSLSGVSEPLREDLMCARLLGNKRIVNLQVSLTSPPVFYSGQGRWSAGIQDPLYGELIAAQQKLADLDKKVSDQAVVDIAGFITSVSVKYARGELSSFNIDITQAELKSIKTQYATGNLDAIVQALRLKIKEAYKAYMITGLENKKGKPPGI
ncbi:MAG TPA: hypothetical protein VLV54_07890 [Thermoanaerobaculia bacterium]|nr:hypothetical protein [Thermoanaerobaculia bacterium]